MSSKGSHGTENSSSNSLVSRPSGSGQQSIKEMGEEEANSQEEEIEQAFVDDANKGNGEDTDSAVGQDRVGASAIVTLSASQCHSWIEEGNRKAESGFPTALGFISKYRSGETKQSITHAKTRACVFGLTGSSSYQFCMPSADDRIFHIRNDVKRLFFYKSAFDMGFRFPCHPFLADVFTFYEIAPSQLMPNAWRQLMCILMVCVYYNIQPSVNVVRDLYELSHSGGWCSLQMRKGYGGTRFSGNDSNHEWKNEFFGVEVEESASWGFNGEWRKPDTHYANRQDYTLEEDEEKLKTILLRQKRSVDVLMHPTRLWLCGLAPYPTNITGTPAFILEKCGPLNVLRQKIIVNCRGERGRKFMKKEVAGQEYKIVVRSASKFVGYGVPVNPEGSAQGPGRGEGLMGLNNLRNAIEQETVVQHTLGDHHVNARQVSPSKERMDFAKLQRLRAEKRAAAAAEKSSTSVIGNDHVAGVPSSVRQSTPPASEVAPTDEGNGAAQHFVSSVAAPPKTSSELMDELELTLKNLKKTIQKEKDKGRRQKETALKGMAELQEELKVAKRMEEDARNALEQEKLERQADKDTAAKNKEDLEAQVMTLRSDLENQFVNVLDAAVVSARYMTLKHKGVDLSDVPLEDLKFPKGYVVPACLRFPDVSDEHEDHVDPQDQADRMSHSGAKRQKTK